MKKYIGLLVVSLVALAMGVSAAVVVEENFDYPDGTAVAGQTGGIGWTNAWTGGNFNVTNAQAIATGASRSTRTITAPVTVGLGDTATVTFDLIRPETQTGRGIGIELRDGGSIEYFIGKKLNGSVGLHAAVGGTTYASFATSPDPETIVTTITYDGANTIFQLSDSNEVLAPVSIPGQLTFDNIGLECSHGATLANGVDDISVDYIDVPSVAGAVVWTGAGTGDGTDVAENWLSTATGNPPTETPGDGLALLYDGGVVITNTGSCIGNIDTGPNVLVINGVTATMTGGNLTGSSVDITEASLEKGIVSNAGVTLNTNAVLQLTDGGNSLTNATVVLNSYAAELTFDNETYTNFVAEHTSKVTAFGDALRFGFDPFVQEAGDNALAISNGTLGVTIKAVVVDLNVDGALKWTNLGSWNATSTIENWALSTASGTSPAFETPTGAGLQGSYSDGVQIVNNGVCNGDLFVGDNNMVISNIPTQFVNGNMSGSGTIDIWRIAPGVKGWIAGGATVTLHAGAKLELTDGNNPLDATVDLASWRWDSVLLLKNETWSDFSAEHMSKVTSFGAALDFGTDPYVEEPGDNALAMEYNGGAGIQITVANINPTTPIGDIVYETTNDVMTLTWDTTDGQIYNVETNANLVEAASWGVFDGPITGTGGGITVTTTVNEVQLFYKVTTP